jgi:hypothetical protein
MERLWCKRLVAFAKGKGDLLPTHTIYAKSRTLDVLERFLTVNEHDYDELVLFYTIKREF